MVIILIGPMGCGKTTIGQLLADRLGWELFDADDYHTKANKHKMSQGIPLNDEDRRPWLESLREIIDEHLGSGNDMLLACSALKESYRQILGIDQKRIFSVFLKGSKQVLESHINSRSHEYMSKELLQSQLDTLEEPKTGLVVDISGTPNEAVKVIVDRLVG